MYISKYTTILEDFPFNGGVTLYNLITKSLVYLNNTKCLINTEEIDEETLLYMKENKMIFKNENDEKKYISQVMKDKYNTNDKLEITMVVSHACNLKCVYCFEGESANENMTIEKADDIMYEIEQRMLREGKREVSIRYYGGEPLMNLPVIDYVNSKMKSKYKDKYSFSIVTNGVLLNEEIINRWTEYNWTGIKITLDGDKEFNDSRRVAKDGKSTYERVMNNLKVLPDDIEVFLHIVVDERNINHFDNMFKELAENKLQSKIIIGISYTHPHIEVIPEHRAQIVLKVAQKARQYGFFLSNLISVDGEGICPNKNHNAYVVDIDGKKLKCTGFMSMKDCPSGVYKGESEKYINSEEECASCKYLPICNGGCQFLKYYNKGKRYCQKKYFDALIKELLKIYIEYEIV